MVRLALLVGTSIFAAFLILNSAQILRENPREMIFERSVNTQATSSLSTASFTTMQEEIPSPVIEDVQVKAKATSSEAQKEVITSAPPPPLVIPPPIADARPASLAPEILNEKSRSALVNILCEATAPLRSTSGSGVIIDSRGVILTNAHIAQLFLFEDSALVSCTIRSGSPARAQWRAKLIFIPELWVKKHAEDILNSRATGTGEHDYAFLLITEALDSSPLPSFPFIPLNTDDVASVTGDPVLIAGYPAEFVGGSAARNSLHASTVFSNVKQLLTFTEDIVDVISVSGTALAQSGSSGGAFVNLYGSLVGLIVTTSIGDTTATRDLHAITPSHIQRSLLRHIGLSISAFLSSDESALKRGFLKDRDMLSKLLSDAIAARRN